MAEVVIRVEKLSKKYTIGHAGEQERYSTLRDVVARHIRTFNRKAKDLFAGQSAIEGDDLEEVWALRDVGFEVRRGEVLGIIGRNGAGKSTLLKVLGRVTEPTAGRVEVRGKVASLLEVGTGFHPELSGRENIFLNGAILGMTREEVKRKFSEIVAFAEIEKFLDTPVKRYSSGMYTRLAFAVAAHLDPEILIIDEVLAVGDAQFQKKCLGKIENIAGGGRTVLIVSHNMGMIGNLCDRVLYFSEGQLIADGRTDDVISQYVQSVSDCSGEVTWAAGDRISGNSRLRLWAARILCHDKPTGDVEIDQPVILEYDFEVLGAARSVSTSVHLHDKHGTWVLCSGTLSEILIPGVYRHACTLPANFLNDGFYTFSLILIIDVTNIEVKVESAISFTVHETGSGREEYYGHIGGCIRPSLPWSKEKIA